MYNELTDTIFIRGVNGFYTQVQANSEVNSLTSSSTKIEEKRIVNLVQIISGAQQVRCQCEVAEYIWSLFAEELIIG